MEVLSMHRLKDPPSQKYRFLQWSICLTGLGMYHDGAKQPLLHSTDSSLHDVTSHAVDSLDEQFSKACP